MIEKVRFYDYLTESWVERYEETDPSKIIECEISAEEFIKRNTGPGSIKSLAEMTPEEQRAYSESLKNEEEDIDEIN